MELDRSEWIVNGRMAIDWTAFDKLENVKVAIKKLNLDNEFSDSEIFLIDGDSLLISVFNDENLNWSFGGEMLHLI